MTRRRTWMAIGLLAVAVVSLGIVGVFGWAEYQRFQAQAAVERQDFSSAYAHISNALLVWPRSAATHLEAAQIARRAGLISDAEQHLAESQRLHNGVSDRMRLERLLLLAMDGDVAAVQENLWRLIEEDHPDKIVILEALVQCYLKVPVAGAGLAAVARLLELQPNNIVGLYGRGVIRERIEDDGSAVADFRHVLAIRPDHTDARKHLADLLVRTDPDEALAHLSILVQQQPDDPALLLSYANCWKGLGQASEAAQRLDALLADHSDHVGALIQRGVLAVEDAQAADGEKWLRRAIFLRPTDEDAHYQLYLCLLQQPGRAAEARAELAEWKRLRADRVRFNEIATMELNRALRDPGLLHEAGSILLRSKRDEDALRLLQAVLEIQPDYEPVHRTLADYYRSKGKYDLAEQHRKKVRSE